MDARRIARWRLHSQRLAGPPEASADAVVERLLGVQAENPAQSAWAVASRTDGLTEEAAFGQLLDDGDVLRTHVLRPTWHYVLPDDVRWLVELTGPRVARARRQVQRDLDLDDATLEAAGQVVADALRGGTHLSRAGVAARLADAGMPVEGMALGVVLAHLETSALVCSGRREDGDHTYALLAERAPTARRLDRQEALAELVLRYVTGHGPVTERDIGYWATLPLADVRAGLADVAGELRHFDHDDRTWWHAGPVPEDRAPSPRAHLLQVLDEFHNGVQDSRYVLDADGIVPRGRARTVGMVLLDGQMVGGMRRTVGADRVVFDVRAHRALDGGELAAVRDAADRYGAFLDLDAELVVEGSGTHG